MVNHPNRGKRRREPRDEWSCPVRFTGLFADKKVEVRAAGGRLLEYEIEGQGFVMLHPNGMTSAELVVRADDKKAATTKVQHIVAACGLRLGV